MPTRPTTGSRRGARISTVAAPAPRRARPHRNAATVHSTASNEPVTSRTAPSTNGETAAIVYPSPSIIPTSAPTRRQVVLEVERQRHHQREHATLGDAGEQHPAVREARRGDKADSPGGEDDAHRDEPRPAATAAVGEPWHHEGHRDRRQVHHREQQPGGTLAPASLRIGIGEPGVQPVVGGPHQREDAHEQPGRAATEAAGSGSRPRRVCGALPRVSTIQATSQPARHERERDQRGPPAAEHRGDRYSERCGDRRRRPGSPWCRRPSRWQGGLRPAPSLRSARSRSRGPCRSRPAT